MSVVDQTWVNRRGLDVVKAFEENRLDDELTSSPALYMWRQRVSASQLQLSSADLMFEHLKTLMERPFGVIPGVRIERLLRAEAVLLGGSGLTPEKDEVLRDLCKKPDGRRLLGRLLDQTQQFLPILYTGEAGNLEERIASHLKVDSELSERLRSGAGLSFSDCDLFFMELPPQDNERAKSYRTALEWVVTQLTVSGFVRRGG